MRTHNLSRIIIGVLGVTALVACSVFGGGKSREASAGEDAQPANPPAAQPAPVGQPAAQPAVPAGQPAAQPAPANAPDAAATKPEPLGPPLDDKFAALLDGGLAVMDMTREDLNFEKRVAENVECQVEAVKTAMDKPLELPKIALRIKKREETPIHEIVPREA